MKAYADAYQPDRSLQGKLRRRVVRLVHRRPLAMAPERPMISFSFDDAPATAAHTGAQLLEARGARGTYFVCGGLAGQDVPMGRCAEAADYRKLAEAGHEIACHTFSHLDCGQASADAADGEAARNTAEFARWGLPAPTTFAYPYGDVAAGPKRALGSRFSVLRALHPGLIELGADLNQAPAVGIEGPEGEARARDWMGRALRARAWLILYTHDVRDDPSPWGCTPQALTRLIDEALAAGFELATVSDAARRLGVC
ncbi:MAG: polysaccharide deacetylase family protein [Phenylobacterium sp.]|uniref:oligosaccharide deacetylase HfsH n=1 Tax=Phenylobacterium sp. TaxID=1871053 RepID=UPI002732EA74|nr:polysaccharide deacetylase family protein [Phenylobacterium sp.]MDP3175151.1 polysaccharide deacetylase family protein [Phenylobacterium sp.]